MLIDNGRGVYGHPIGGYWMDMGTKERYRKLHWDLLDRHFPAIIEEQPTADPHIWVGERVKVGNNVRFLSPVIIASDVTIGDSATIGPYAVIGKHCAIGSHTRISSSILWDRCRIRPGSQLSDCILGYGTEAGTRILVEDEVRQ